jgi:hypothetical protein
MSSGGNRTRRLRLALLIVGMGVLGVGVTLWLMFQHIPSWYRPPAIVPVNSELSQRVRNDWLGVIGDLRDELVRSDTPFDYSVSQDQLNAWLAVREVIPKLPRNWLPPSMSEPFVLIERDGVRLAATYRSGGIRTVLSARLEIAVESSGIRVKLAEVAGGSLGMPESWVVERLALLDGRTWPAGQRSDYQVGGPPLPALTGLYEGVSLPNTWLYKEVDRRFRVKGLRFQPGTLLVTLEPLPRTEH